MGCCNEMPSRVGSIQGRRRGNGGECGGRSESRCVSLFFFNPITCAANLKLFMRLPKEKPAQGRAGFSLDKLETPGGKNFLAGVTRISPARHISIVIDCEEHHTAPRIH